ncbi:MAG: hypothetical protein ABIK73_09080 [candidate division WOR-3 bacterium]
MPPRAQRLYPRMRERPPEFVVNPAWPWYGALLCYIGPRSAVDAQTRIYDCTGKLIFTTSTGVSRPYSYDNRIYRHVIDFRNQTRSYLSTIQVTQPLQITVFFWQSDFTISANGCPFAWEVLNTFGFSFWDSSTGSWWLDVYSPSKGTFSLSGLYTNPPHVFAARVRLGQQNIFVNGRQTSAAYNMQYGSTNVFIGSRSGSYFYNGVLSDITIVGAWIPDDHLIQVSDPSNVDLRIGGIPLILPPRRRLWPVAPVAEYVKRRQLGLRAGSREVVT